MRDRNENEFFNSDYSRYNSGSADYNQQDRSHKHDWASRAGDEVQSWFGDNDAGRRRRMDENRDNRSDNSSQFGNSGYDCSGNYSSGSFGNQGSAYDRNYGTNQSNFGYHNNGSGHLDRDSSRYSSHNSEYDPLRSVYGGPGHTTDGYGHESRRDFTTGDWSNSNRGMGNDYRSDNRDWTERTGDEVRSWFGNEDAERRRRQDEMSDNRDDWSRDRSWNNRNTGFSRW